MITSLTQIQDLVWTDADQEFLEQMSEWQIDHGAMKKESSATKTLQRDCESLELFRILKKASIRSHINKKWEVLEKGVENLLKARLIELVDDLEARWDFCIREEDGEPVVYYKLMHGQ